MEEEVHVTRYVPTPLDHSPAAVSLDMLCLDMPAMVRICACILLLHCHLIIFIDINECAIGTSGCSQLCNNTIGSYVCACNPGYQLSYDNKTCSGELWEIRHISNNREFTELYKVIRL